MTNTKPYTSSDDTADMMSKLIKEYANELPGRIRTLTQTIDRMRDMPGDATLQAEAINQAHRLRGTAPTYGFAPVGQCMRRIEEALKEVNKERGVWHDIEQALIEAKLSADADEPMLKLQIPTAKCAPNPVIEITSDKTQPYIICDALLPIKVLLVEDDADYHRYIKHVANFGSAPQFQLEWRTSLSEALDFLSGETPDVILLDLLLPDSDGLNTFLLLKERCPGIPIVILTANEDQQLGLDAVAAGAQDYLSKQQVSIDSLLRCTRYAIERKRHEESRLRLTAVEDFIGTLAHDLQVPMIGADLVLRGLITGSLGKLSDEQKNAISLLKDGNDALLDLVKRLLDIYRYESEQMPILFENIDLKTLIGDSLHAHSASIKERKLEVNSDVSPHLSNIPGDRLMLSQLIGNLLDNAIKFSPQGSTIDIWVKDLDGAVSIHLKNYGDPIPLENQTRLFDRFWQGVPGKKYVAHTGTGLYLCHRIVALHRGRISCQSTQADGTTFTVLLPSARRGTGFGAAG